MSFCSWFGLFFFLLLSRKVLASINIAANTQEQWWIRCDVMRKDKGSLQVQKATKSSMFSLLSTVSWSPSHSLPFTVQKPEHPPFLLSVTGPSMCWINTKWQNSRACRSIVCVCVVICVCECVYIPVNVWMWDLAYHRDMSHPSPLPLSVSCMQLICFDRWPSPIQTAYLRKETNKPKTAPGDACVLCIFFSAWGQLLQLLPQQLRRHKGAHL